MNKRGQLLSAQNTIVGAVVIYVVLVVYTVYMAWLNHKQAKVGPILLKTNEILERIEKKLDKRKGEGNG